MTTKADFLKGVAVEFVRTVTFSAAHRYAIPGVEDDENKRIFGSLYRDEGFGHNFLLEAHFTGPVDFQTGMIANLVEIDAWLKAVASRFDHKMLNEVPEFKDLAPTLERIALSFYQQLRAAMPTSIKLVKVRLHEGDQTWIDYFG